MKIVIVDMTDLKDLILVEKVMGETHFKSHKRLTFLIKMSYWSI